VVHRLRQGWQEERTAGLNRLRGLLTEFGRVYPNSATAATVVNPQQFRCGRQFAAWLGITQRQYSTGGKPRLGRTTRHGDTNLHGAAGAGGAVGVAGGLADRPGSA
jgi:transposase